MLRLAALLLLLWPAWAQAISYTVQVVAVSDQASALDVQRDLLDASYPAYVVRASIAQGDIFRVRVGAFANRPAALLFASAMPQIAGGPPLPALAEGIPAGVMPLEPRVLTQLSAEEVQVLPWRDGLALRVQADPAVPASYHVFRGDETLVFEAWHAQPGEDEVLRLRNLSLWPASWEEEGSEAREEYRVALLDSVAEQLGVTAAELEKFQRRPVYGAPFLPIVERMAFPGTDGIITAVAEADGAISGYGPRRIALGGAALESPDEPHYLASADSEPASGSFAGDGWQASAAGRFFLLSPTEDGRAWRAGVGTPLWGDGSYLLTRSSEEFILYDFIPR